MSSSLDSVFGKVFTKFTSESFSSVVVVSALRYVGFLTTIPNSFEPKGQLAWFVAMSPDNGDALLDHLLMCCCAIAGPLSNYGTTLDLEVAEHVFDR